jgi:hypothetical protein
VYSGIINTSYLPRHEGLLKDANHTYSEALRPASAVQRPDDTLHATPQCGVLGFETCPAEQTELPVSRRSAPGTCAERAAALRVWLAGSPDKQEHGGYVL